MSIEERLNEIEEARQKFMRGEMSANTYWNIKRRNLSAIWEYNEKQKEVKNDEK